MVDTGPILSRRDVAESYPTSRIFTDRQPSVTVVIGFHSNRLRCTSLSSHCKVSRHFAVPNHNANTDLSFASCWLTVQLELSPFTVSDSVRPYFELLFYFFYFFGSRFPDVHQRIFLKLLHVTCF